MTLIGMWMPGKHPVEIEHGFFSLDEEGAVRDFVEDVVGRGRTPLVTVEPRGRFPDRDDLNLWPHLLRSVPGPVYVRTMHEFNGDWYPWAGDPDRFRHEWARWTAVMPPNVRNVWCPNVSYPGSLPIADFWPLAGDGVDVVGLDGYARNGETPAELFRPTMEEMFETGIFRVRLPFWIAETAAPRGRRQARYAGALRGFAEQQGIEACVWFNQDKAGQGPEERDWTLTKGAARALLEERA